jgi:hypothetical protein
MGLERSGLGLTRARDAPTQLEHYSERGAGAGGLAIDDQHIEICQRAHHDGVMQAGQPFVKPT